MASASSKKVVLISNDDKAFEVDEAVAMLSLTVKNLIEAGCIVDGGIRLPNVDSATLAKVLVYCDCEYHAPDPYFFYDFNSKYVKNMIDDMSMLFAVTRAANYLNIEGLLDVMIKAISNTIAGKTPEEIRQTFCIKNDFTAEEEAAVREEIKWALE